MRPGSTPTSQGVNRYIEQCGKKLPWEFRLLRHRPAAMARRRQLTIGKGLALLLSTALYTRLNFFAARRQGFSDDPEKLRRAFPSLSDRRAGYRPRDVQIRQRALLAFLQPAFSPTTDWHRAGSGSNSWAIAPGEVSNPAARSCATIRIYA